MVVRAHFGFADGRVYLHALERLGNLHRIGRLGLVRRGREHVERRLQPIVAELVVLAGEALLVRGSVGIELGQRIVVIFADLLDGADRRPC